MMQTQDTIWKTFGKAGPWALLAVMLVVFYLYKLDPAIEALTRDHASMRAEIAEQRSEASDENKQLLNVLGQLVMSSERTVYLQRVACQNEADTAEELRACAKDH